MEYSYYEAEDVQEIIADIFNSLVYQLVKHYDFNIEDLKHFFDLYEKETGFLVNLDFSDELDFTDFKKFALSKYYKDVFDPN